MKVFDVYLKLTWNIFNKLIILFQTLDETVRGEGGFGSTGTNWSVDFLFIVPKLHFFLIYKNISDQ